MSATVFDKQGSKLTVKPAGRLDTATSPVFESELRPRLEGVNEVVMDFSDVEYISSGGIRVLLVAQQQLESNGGSVKLIHVNRHIVKILDLVGFLNMMTVEQD